MTVPLSISQPHKFKINFLKFANTTQFVTLFQPEHKKASDGTRMWVNLSQLKWCTCRRWFQLPTSVQARADSYRQSKNLHKNATKGYSLTDGAQTLNKRKNYYSKPLTHATEKFFCVDIHLQNFPRKIFEYRIVSLEHKIFALWKFLNPR